MSKDVTVALAHPALLIQGEVFLCGKTGLADLAAALHCLTVGEFQADHAAHRSQNAGSWIYFLMVVNFGSSAPHWKIALNILNAPLFSLAVGALHGADTDYSFAKSSFHQFFAIYVLAF